MRDFITKMLVTGFGVGYFPIASGTLGTLLAVPLFIYLARGGTGPVLAGVVVISIVGVPLASRMEYLTRTTDPKPVVIDEIAGYLLAMAGSPADPVYMVLGFFIFRFFDIVKPPPIRKLERTLSGGVGIMVDDLFAGMYSWLVLRLIERIFL
ncbi:MAG: phosphatidylglycerophosphatase A [bacterium]